MLNLFFKASFFEVRIKSFYFNLLNLPQNTLVINIFMLFYLPSAKKFLVSSYRSTPLTVYPTTSRDSMKLPLTVCPSSFLVEDPSPKASSAETPAKKSKLYGACAVACCQGPYDDTTSFHTFPKVKNINLQKTFNVINLITFSEEGPQTGMDPCLQEEGQF